MKFVVIINVFIVYCTDRIEIQIVIYAFHLLSCVLFLVFLKTMLYVIAVKVGEECFESVPTFLAGR